MDSSTRNAAPGVDYEFGGNHYTMEGGVDFTTGFKHNYIYTSRSTLSPVEKEKISLVATTLSFVLGVYGGENLRGCERMPRFIPEYVLFGFVIAHGPFLGIPSEGQTCLHQWVKLL